MKRRVLSCLLCFCLLAAGCSAKRTQTGERTESTSSVVPTWSVETTSAMASTEETETTAAIPTTAADSTQAETEASDDLRENEALPTLPEPVKARFSASSTTIPLWTGILFRLWCGTRASTTGL